MSRSSVSSAWPARGSPTQTKPRTTAPPAIAAVGVAWRGAPADAGVGDVARGGGQPVRLGGAIERAEQCTALDASSAGDRIDRDAAHRRQIDHEAAVRHGKAGDVVPAAAHTDLEIEVAGQAD